MNFGVKSKVIMDFFFKFRQFNLDGIQKINYVPF